MTKNINIAPMYELLTDSFDADYVSVILDRIIFNYTFAVLSDEGGLIDKRELLDDLNLLLQLRNSTRLCTLN